MTYHTNDETGIDAIKACPLTLNYRMRRHSARAAFTLIEMVMAIGVILILASISLTVFGGVKAQQLASGGNRLVDMANQARQNSIAKNALTALVMINASSNANANFQLFTIMELTPESTQWIPASPWKPLPQGIVVDPQVSADFLISPSLPIPIGKLKYGNTTFNPGQYVYQVFMSDGQLVNSATLSSPALRLVEGMVGKNNQIVYTSAKGSMNAANFYDITINRHTGLPIIDRP